jgi:crotonobetainyl-CoA:carnitine CoA-transferase CaiB-like acyl-CoA transferase
MSGVRVVEVAAWTYVPAAGAVLAEWGADVIKIEHPETGDPQRGLVSSGLVPASGGINHMIELPNRGKRSVAIDLATDEGRELLDKLVATADVFVTNFLPDARRKLRIEVDDIRAVNPKAIYVRGSGQGQRGPEAERGGYDACSFWGRAVADVATPSGMPWPIGQPGPGFGDLIGGLTIAGGISAALFHRERTGEAVVVDNSLLATAMWATGASVLAAGLFGFSKMPMGDRRDMFNPIVNTYRTSDGRFLSLIMLQSDRYWPELVSTMGHPELVDDPRFADAKARYENRQVCVDTLDEIFATRTFEEWRAVLSDIEGVWAPVQTSGELLQEPQVLANGYISQVQASNGTNFAMVPSPLQFNEIPAELTRAPEHGEHTDEVLPELGLPMDQILDLKVKGAVA